MKHSTAGAYLTVVCFFLGVLIVVQLRSTSRAASITTTSDDEARVLSGLVESNSGLSDEIAQLQAQLLLLNPANQQEATAALEAELSRLLVVSGAAEASGPGVQVNVSGQINPLDMQDLINELRNAGVEAIALDGHRVVVNSVVARDGADLVLDGATLVPPYTLDAIGEPDTIEKALLRRGGLVGLLEYAYPGLKITVTKADSVTLPAYPYRQNQDFKFAQPVP